jgi:hypothetical protein
MGFYQSAVAGVLEQRGDQFVQHNQVLNQDEKAFLSWTRPPAGPLPDGWTTLAEGTLRAARVQWEQLIEYEVCPVEVGRDPGTFTYGYHYDSPGVPSVFHLLLPANHVPRIDRISPLPAYARVHQDRLILGWIQPEMEWFRFVFGAAERGTFEALATAVCDYVEGGNGSAPNLSGIRTQSLERQHEIRRRNLEYLEERAALYGIDVPLWLHNQLGDAQAELAGVEQRLRLAS